MVSPMAHPLNIIGPQVRALREAAGLTQEQLAARCQRLGLDITRGTLAKIEAAVRSISDHEIPFIARALSVSLDVLFPDKLLVVARKARNPNGARRKIKRTKE
ncbi:MAG: helix-turn-helix transcriptional regulator [Verrucomicrobiota bacterium]